MIGPFLGAVAGELLNQRSLNAAGRAGIGATVGLVLGVAAKLALGIAMVGVFLFMRIHLRPSRVTSPALVLSRKFPIA